MPFYHVDQVVNALFVGSKNRFIRNGLFRLFTPYGYDKPSAIELTHELLNKSDINPEVSAVDLSMDEIRALCFSFKLLQEKEKLTLANRDVKNDEEIGALEGFNDDNDNIPTDPKYVVQF